MLQWNYIIILYFFSIIFYKHPVKIIKHPFEFLLYNHFTSQHYIKISLLLNIFNLKYKQQTQPKEINFIMIKIAL